MRRNKLWLLLPVLGLVLSLMACGPKAAPAAKQAAPASVEATPRPKPVEVTPAKKEAPSSGGFWADIPVYPGARQIEKMEMAVPGAQEPGEFETLEWRYYETEDDVEEVASFYKTEMPKEGWEEVLWMNFSEKGSVGSWQKKEGEIAAFASMAEDQEGNTVLVIWRGEGKK